jgi:hypothetical protein
VWKKKLHAIYLSKELASIASITGEEKPVWYEKANDEDARPLTPVIESSGYEKDGPSHDFLFG